jgi:predicted DNA-binding protein
MSTQVTVTLPDEVYQRAERLAKLTGREIGDLLVDTINISLPTLAVQSGSVRAVSSLTDEEIIALADLQPSAAQNQRLTILLDKQQDGQLTLTERSELTSHVQVYEEGLLRKAQALREAVRRGLREPLTR